MAASQNSSGYPVVLVTFVLKTQYKPDVAEGHACNPGPWKVEAGEPPVQAHYQPYSGLEPSLDYVKSCLNSDKTKPTTKKPAEPHTRASASVSRWLQDDLFYTVMVSPRNSHILSLPWNKKSVLRHGRCVAGALAHKLWPLTWAHKATQAGVRLAPPPSLCVRLLHGSSDSCLALHRHANG